MSLDKKIVLLPRARLDLSDSSLAFLKLNESKINEFQNLLDESLLETSLKSFYANKNLALETITATRILPTPITETNFKTLRSDRHKSYDIIIFVSKNAGALAKLILNDYFFQQAKLFSVGKSCAVFFKKQGFDLISAQEESAQGLLGLSEFSNLSGNKILICKGAKGLRDLQEGCELRGAQVEVLDLYQRESVQGITLPKQEIAEIYGVSVFALQHLLEGVSESEATKLRKIPLRTMSERIAKAAKKMGFTDLSVLRV